MGHMGQWRLQIHFTMGIGIYIAWSKQEIAIAVPFITCYIGLTRSARGFDIFGKRKY